MGQTTKPRVSWLCSYRFGAKNGPANKLREALDQLEHVTTLHGALKKSFLSIYGYTSDEQGIRHPLIDADAAKVDETDALFMIGACGNHLAGSLPPIFRDGFSCACSPVNRHPTWTPGQTAITHCS